MNPWHDVPYGKEAPAIVNAIIEIPQGSKGKYEIDKQTGLIKLDRVLFSAVYYPANYGFIPQTYCGDKDPLDILVLSTIDLPQLCLVEAKVIGVMRMVDQGDADDKIIAVARYDVSVNHINDLDELPPHTTKAIRRFFEDYKLLENKTVEIEAFFGRDKALKIIEESIGLYQSTFSTAS
jgi:inorganic pyrophosphatase